MYQGENILDGKISAQLNPSNRIIGFAHWSQKFTRAEGGQFKAVNSRFIGNRCYRYGPDLGGGAIRALAQYRNRPVYITGDTFRGGRCSNGAALSSIGFGAITAFSALLFIAQGWPAWPAFTVFASVFILTRLFLGHLSDHFAAAKVALICVLVEAVGLALIWILPSLALALTGRWPMSCVNPEVLAKSSLRRWQPVSMERGPNS